jgi:hypothetical protein
VSITFSSHWRHGMKKIGQIPASDLAKFYLQKKRRCIITKSLLFWCLWFFNIQTFMYMLCFVQLAIFKSLCGEFFRYTSWYYVNLLVIILYSAINYKHAQCQGYHVDVGQQPCLQILLVKFFSPVSFPLLLSYFQLQAIWDWKFRFVCSLSTFVMVNS